MVKESNYCIFKFEKQDKNLIDILDNYINDNAERIFRFFEVSADKKAIINIIPTKQKFDDLLRKDGILDEEEEAPKWLIGISREHVIDYVSLNDFKNTSHIFANHDKALEYYKKTILHEFVHFVNQLFNEKHNCKPTSKYLTEGIASVLSGQREGKIISYDFSIEEILGEGVFQDCYDGWDLTTKYLLDNYDKQFVLSLFKDKKLAIEFFKTELFSKLLNINI